MRNFRHWTAALLMLASPAVAEDPGPVVVELYTSQGCSSCPPADAYFLELARQEGIVALAMHVDYWDYIGWKDSFADPDYTARQKSYAAAQGKQMVYTPQMIVDGTYDVAGTKPDAVATAIAKHRAEPNPVALKLRREGGSLHITATPRGAVPGRMDVTLLRYQPKATVAIKSGENAGRTLSYANIVTSMEALGTWTGETPLRLTQPIKGDSPVTVLIQQSGHGPITAAAKLE
ncbi:thioredoxin family protein [Roseovarius sp. MMSF_3281]|uniref:DUF1223 domain-containing protein n=1 Tax=Roseovarius sp. MMSF_3281 TaxID=3046694 RepID=UPI00273FD17D|nr:DUF1223 domain-containing protein [Roseovarius sp. MMSF_3281]